MYTSTFVAQVLVQTKVALALTTHFSSPTKEFSLLQLELIGFVPLIFENILSWLIGNAHALKRMQTRTTLRLASNMRIMCRCCLGRACISNGKSAIVACLRHNMSLTAQALHFTHKKTISAHARCKRRPVCKQTITTTLDSVSVKTNYNPVVILV